MSVEHPIVEYRQIPGFEGYRFGSDGSAWSRHNWRTRRRECEDGWYRLEPKPHSAGFGISYYAITLCADGRQRRKRLHQWIALAFLGPCPDGMEVCHKDGNGLNCAADNLRYDTRKGNMADCVEHGTRNWGTRNGQAKIGPEQVREIRARAAAGESYGSIAADYGISTTQAGRIARGKKWKVLLESNNSDSGSACAGPRRPGPRRKVPAV